MCESEEISLKHTSFLRSNKVCNNGEIVAQGLTVVNSSYTSGLTVTLRTELIGATVACSVDTTNVQILVGNDTLSNSKTSK